MLNSLRKLPLFNNSSIRSQIMLGVAGVYALMMLLFVTHLLHNQRTLIIEQHGEQATYMSEVLAESASGLLATADIATLQKIISAQRNYQELAFALVADKEGRILAHSDPARVGFLLADLPAEARQTMLSRELGLVDVATPVLLAGRQVGWSRVGITQHIAEGKQALLFRNAISYTLAAILLGLILVWFMISRFSKRLSVVQETIDAVRSGDRQARIPRQGCDEVDTIAEEFNDLLDTLQARDGALLRLDQQNEMILNAAGEGIYGVDADGLILFANPAAAQMLGYQPAEMVGKHSHQLIHSTRANGDPYPMADCPLQKSFREGTVCRSENEVFWTKDGRMFPVEHVNTPIFAEGRVAGAVVVFRDIGPRKAAAEKLRLANLVIESSPSVIFRWQAAAEWPVEYVSDNVSRYGYAAADLLNGEVAYSALIHPGDLSRVNEELARHVAAGLNSFSHEYRLVAANGEIRVVEHRTTVERDELGRATHYQGIINDITEHRRLESQLRQSQKMEAIGTLAGGIAHDFNNILTAIIGFGEIVMAKLPPDSPLRHEQGHVLQAGERAKDLVKQILTFSRSSEKQLQNLLMQFIVKEALKLIRASLPSTIEIREEIDVYLRPLLADPVQIHQVVMNLCTNAYQAMRETGGVMKVTLKSTKLSLVEARELGNLPPGAYALLEVSDTGCGMSQAIQERIFEPYFTTKGKGEGTGMGLPMVHGIITGLGGAITVQSAPGQGSTFRIFLPLAEKEEREVLPEPSVEVVGGNESVLIVDDEEVIVSLECQFLQELGYRVSGFTESEKALQAFRDAPGDFDLLITDMTMPRLTGADLAKEILLLRPDMPIMICTGHSELLDATKARALGIREYLAKPVTRAKLAKAVRAALAERPPLATLSAHE